MSEAPLLFLDANALASPVTRTLLIAGARAGGLRWTWSRHVEVEADRHARGQASRTSTVRQKILGTELSPTANSTEGLVTVTTHDRQVMADAIRAGSRYLITSDVDDFAFDDLAAHGMSAVPHLAAQFAGAYDTRPVLADPDQPSTLFRGISCIRCEAHLDDAVGLQRGLCPEHLVR